MCLENDVDLPAGRGSTAPQAKFRNISPNARYAMMMPDIMLTECTSFFEYFNMRLCSCAHARHASRLRARARKETSWRDHYVTGRTPKEAAKTR